MVTGGAGWDEGKHRLDASGAGPLWEMWGGGGREGASMFSVDTLVELWTEAHSIRLFLTRWLCAPPVLPLLLPCSPWAFALIDRCQNVYPHPLTPSIS